MWCLATSAGGAVRFEPYCGVHTRIHDYGSLGGQGPNVVLDLVKKSALKEGSLLYCDNLFTSTALLKELSCLGIGCTGNNPVPRVFKGCT